MADADGLHRRSVVVDAHNDLLMLCARRPPEAQAAYFRRVWLPQLRAGGVDVQILPVFIDDDFRPEGALRQTLRMIETAWRVAEGNSDVLTLCRDAAEVDDALAGGRIAGVLALEGCEAVGSDVELLALLYRLGVRVASFTHFGRTALADGSAEDATGGRLTRAGVAALGLMEELGIVCDISHLGAAGVDHVLELARRPVVATHSSVRALLDHHRNLTDERLKGLADSGGVVGINLFAGFIDAQAPTVARAVDHIEHAVELLGADHVGLGPDFIDEVYRELSLPITERVVEGLDTGRLIEGLEGPAGLPLVTAEMVRRGWPEQDVSSVLGSSFLRVLRAEMGVPLSGRGAGVDPVGRR